MTPKMKSVCVVCLAIVACSKPAAESRVDEASREEGPARTTQTDTTTAADTSMHDMSVAQNHDGMKNMPANKSHRATHSMSGSMNHSMPMEASAARHNMTASAMSPAEHARMKSTNPASHQSQMTMQMNVPGHASKPASVKMDAMGGMSGMSAEGSATVNHEATARLKELVGRLLRDSVVLGKARSDTALLRRWAADTAHADGDHHKP